MIIPYDKVPSSKFIVFEGPNGSGKSSLITYLKNHPYFKQQNILFTKEPGGSKKIGNFLRDLILDNSLELDNISELFMILADRREHVIELKETNKKIISDRYIYSTIAFQGAGRMLGSNWTKELCLKVCDNFLPDLVVLIDCDPAIGLSRKISKDRIESEDLIFHERVREEFLKLAREEPIPFVIINTDNADWENYKKIAYQIILRAFNV